MGEGGLAQALGALCPFIGEIAGKCQHQILRGSLRLRWLLGFLGLIAGGAAFVVGEVALTQSNVFRRHFD